jgi:hypothetical protein
MSELSTIAKSLAMICRYHVFPCEGQTKRPAWGKREGGHGFYDASTDPNEIARLFSHPRADLIGIRTGSTSGVSVLDIDAKHGEACAWWQRYERHFPATRTYRTRGGGLHLYFQHRPGVINSEGRPVIGIDSRGEGGYVIFWFAAGFECLDHSPPAPWPIWLSALLWPAPKPITIAANNHAAISERELERVRQTAIRKAREAGDGTRHYSIRAAARLLGGIQSQAGFTDADAMTWLLDATGLHDEKKAQDTIAWGLEKGRSEPLKLEERHYAD